MSSISPQLPPHLAKRKRSPEDDGPTPPPPTKISRGTTNPAEISLDDSDSDSHGPAAAPAHRSPRPQGPSIGPTMPPAPTANADEIDLSDSDSDTGPAPAIGPTMPRPSPPPRPTPPQPAKKPIGPSMPPPRQNADELNLSDSDADSGPAPPPKRTYGPSLPAPLSERPPAPPSDSDSDSDYGPALPSASRRPAKPLPQPAAPVSKRDDWMLAPPSETSYRSQDISKPMKNRTFRSGPSAAAGPASGGMSSLWTETAAEKLARVQNAVLGRNDDPDPPPGSAAAGVSQEEADQRRRIEQHIAQTRGKSLMEERKEARKAGKMGGKAEEEDDPSKRPFDREKDMGLGGRLGAAQKREFMGRAANFGDRFAKGSYL